jgi:pilus assembly protein CpaC
MTRLAHRLTRTARGLPVLAGVLLFAAQGPAPAQAQAQGQGQGQGQGQAQPVPQIQPGPAVPDQAPTPDQPAERGTLTLDSGAGKVVTLPVPAANVFVADPHVAEVRPASATSLFIFAVGAGHTTVAAMDEAGHVLAQYEVVVHRSAFGAQEAQAAIARLLPGSHVQVEAQSRGLLLTGQVSSPQDAARAVAIVRGYNPDLPNIDNEIAINTPVQVNLNVRIAQMSRQVVRKLGINWSALANIGRIGMFSPALTLSASTTTTSITATCPTCVGAGFLGVIDALANDNLAHVLAQPNLTVMSGQTASFQVGGEFPVPVTGNNSGQIVVDYKDYGVMLSFLPTVMSDGRINLHVKPEVSELSAQNATQITSGNSTLVIPALTVRRAETTIELGSGQSFAIAGLLQQETSDASSGLPGAGDVPILGSLFHDNQLSRTETELVIVVTPYIVRPVDNAASLHLPTDGYRPPSDFQRLLFMRQVASQQAPVPVRLPGDAGFIVQ